MSIFTGSLAVLSGCASVAGHGPDSVPAPASATVPSIPVLRSEALAMIARVNDHWQATTPATERAFWDVAVYHTGNMAAYQATGNEAYRRYSERWAEANQWKGARSDNKAEWKLTYGETDDHVLFGDWQVCFQIYLDLYALDKDPRKVARARDVMGYQIGTARNDYWWWVDGLYMVMPVMTKMYRLTGDARYLDKLNEYFQYTNSISRAALVFLDDAGMATELEHTLNEPQRSGPATNRRHPCSQYRRPATRPKPNCCSAHATCSRHCANAQPKQTGCAPCPLLPLPPSRPPAC